MPKSRLPALCSRRRWTAADAETVFSADGKLDVSTMEAAELALIIEGIDLAGARRRARWEPRKTSGAEVAPRLFSPDLDQLRAWLERMVAALKFAELVVAIIGFIGRMHDINLELTKRVAQLTRKRPRSETLERLEPQLVLPLTGLVAPSAKPRESTDTDATKQRKKTSRWRRTRGVSSPYSLSRGSQPGPPSLRLCPSASKPSVRPTP